MRAASRSEWLAVARSAEALGYATLVMPDHLQNQLSPLAALAAAAQATSRLRLGSYVVANAFRHPALLAKEAATVDLLSDGRFELGIGAGWRPADFEQAGLCLGSPRERIERLEEALQVIKGLFAEAPLTYAGRHYAVKGLVGTPRPVQRPRPPIMVAGGGRRMLSLAAREADIVGLLPRAPADGSDPARNLADGSAAATAQKIAWLREAAGERFNHLELSVLVKGVLIDDDRRGTAGVLAAWLGSTPEVVLETPYLLVGTLDQIVADIEARRERYGISYLVVPHRYLEEFAPVVARLAGR